MVSDVCFCSFTQSNERREVTVAACWKELCISLSTSLYNFVRFCSLYTKCVSRERKGLYTDVVQSHRKKSTR